MPSTAITSTTCLLKWKDSSKSVRYKNRKNEFESKRKNLSVQLTHLLNKNEVLKLSTIEHVHLVPLENFRKFTWISMIIQKETKQSLYRVQSPDAIRQGRWSIKILPLYPTSPSPAPSESYASFLVQALAHFWPLGEQFQLIMSTINYHFLILCWISFCWTSFCCFSGWN